MGEFIIINHIKLRNYSAIYALSSKKADVLLLQSVRGNHLWPSFHIMREPLSKYHQSLSLSNLQLFNVIICSVPAMMSYQVRKNSPIEGKLNTNIRRLIESGLTDFYTNQCVFLIQLSGAITSRKLNLFNVEFDNRITMEHLRKPCVLFIAVSMIAILIFVIEAGYFYKNKEFNGPRSDDSMPSKG